MDGYVYLIIPIAFSFAWLSILFARPDLKEKILRASFLGGLAGLVAELWYFRDYWHPPLIFGGHLFSIEDFLFGFFFTGVAVSSYDFVFNKRSEQKHKSRKLFFGGMFLFGFLSLLIFNNLLGLNSIIVSTIVPLLLAVVMIFMRTDLLMPSIWSGILAVLLAIPIYVVIFDIISPDWWNKYWLLSNTKFGIMVFGHVPLTELVWYFAWGCFAGISHEFFFGNKKVK